MTNYYLTMKVQDPALQRQLSQGGIGPYIEVEWNDDYAVAATRDNFMEGARVQASTDTDSIRLGQTYTLNQDYRGSVNNGGPQDSIRFNNQADRVSPIIYRTINGFRVPIYVGTSQIPRSATQEIKPNNKVKVWLQSNCESGTMINGIYGESLEVDMSGRTSVKVFFDEDYKWSVQV
ncbi:hypothetical protein FGADI_5752 [Fusarium gaditjirri]|uniref:Uncharacterized protein n=1 Tax=Fusarium gaditjirri TaxID=282569 RepID=A0A8H4T9L0_9HYPO|nr:hypothetical protein FGADI_5752 [Fusarium gaditjirri]